MSDDKIKQLIDSFIEYRDLLQPLQESLRSVSDSYGEIKRDLETLSKNFSSEEGSVLDKVHSTLNAQAKSGQRLSEKIDEYSRSGEQYAREVKEFSSKMENLSSRLDSLQEIERQARSQTERIEKLIEEKKSSYNLKELKQALDGYNTNVERISDFINKDIAAVLKDNAEKIEGIKRENEQLSNAVLEQSKDVQALTAAFGEISGFLKQVVEGSTVNEQYLFDAFDKWAADRGVKIKKK